MVEIFGSYAALIILGLAFLVMLVTAPCHAVFVLPFVGLPLFWLLPPEYALPINLAVWLASFLLYRVFRGAMRRPLADGFQSLVGTRAEIVSSSKAGRSARYMVRAHGELWSAYSTDSLNIGEQVNIAAVKGIGVVVERAEPDSQADEISDAKPIVSGTNGNRPHCH